MLAIPALLFPFLAPAATDVDSDGDGLSDFHEVHKYGTDPASPDSDGDGVPDGEWRERREYAYTVRAIVDVIRPVTPDVLCDDYQDARVLDETDDHVELEVILYPFGTAADAIGAGSPVGDVPAELAPWLEPGPTADWTPELQRRLRRALRDEGIDLDGATDRQLAEEASAWLLQRTTEHDGFTTFLTSFDEQGRPFVDEALRPAAERGMGQGAESLEECWQRELSATGMFERRTRGSCTSTAIYLEGCLRALGLPTRTVLFIPLVDANDPCEHDMVARLEHNRVRSITASAARSGKGSWTSHTFNEVWVDGRWRRLDYSRLGQGILAPDALGLRIHVATFRDWADADMPNTLGRRQGLGAYDDVCGGPNPYSTVALRDEFGPHCSLENPPPAKPTAVVEALHWTDDPALPEDVLANCRERGRYGLIAMVHQEGDEVPWAEFLERSDDAVLLEAEGRAAVATAFHAGCYWIRNGELLIYLPFDADDRREFAAGVEYAARARNAAGELEWELDLPIRRD